MLFDSLKFIGNKKQQVDTIYEDISNAVKKNVHDVSGLLEFVENRGTTVVRGKHVDKVLYLFGKTVGFLPPMKGLKAKGILYFFKMMGIWKHPITEKTPPMFAFSEKDPAMGYMIHQLHHWLSYNNGLPGYSEEAQSKLSMVLDPTVDMEDLQAEFEKMSSSEVKELREAIARDQEALMLIQKLAQEVFEPQSTFDAIKDQESKG